MKTTTYKEYNKLEKTRQNHHLQKIPTLIPELPLFSDYFLQFIVLGLFSHTSTQHKEKEIESYMKNSKSHLALFFI